MFILHISVYLIHCNAQTFADVIRQTGSSAVPNKMPYDSALTEQQNFIDG